MISDLNFWESRFNSENYVYGKVACRYFKEQVRRNTAGKLLCLCEGEGRNATYASAFGWKVVAMDFSSNARAKALEFAKEKNTSYDYHLCDIRDFPFEKESFDYVAMIHCHFTPELRDFVFEKVVETLKPGGGLIFEGFSTDQFGKRSGGPKEMDQLYTVRYLKDNLPDFYFRDLKQLEYMMDEGFYHVGMASVIQFMAYKADD